jgi:hypothetical protein
VLHLGVDGWQQVRNLEARPVGLGQYGVRLDPGALGAATASLEFTRYFPEGNRWEGRDYQVRLEGRDQSPEPCCVMPPSTTTVVAVM